MTVYTEFYRGVLIRKPNYLAEEAVNLTPNLGVAMHIDPELVEKPVIEIVRLSMGEDRSVYLSFQDDMRLAVWDPKERDSFFDQANRGGLKHLFRNSRLEHKANVLAAINVLSGHVMDNMHQAIAGKIEPKSRELDADFAKELLEMTYNDVAQQASAIFDASYTGNLSPKAFGYAVERVMRAIDDHWLHKSPSELFQSIMMSNRNLCDALMSSMKDGSSYFKNLVNESTEWVNRENYFRQGFRDFNILTAERHSLEYTKLSECDRASDDFSGDFQVKTDLWTPQGEIERHFNVIGAANHGLDVGPSNFRRYANIQKRIGEGSHWLEPGSLLKDATQGESEDRRHSIMKGTPPDLPLELAEKRLNVIRTMPGSDESVAELQEIIQAEEQGRSLNVSVFREESVKMKTATSMIENHTLEQLENVCLTVRSNAQALPGDSKSNLAGRESMLANLEADETEYWLKNHPDYEGEDSGHDRNETLSI